MSKNQANGKTDQEKRKQVPAARKSGKREVQVVQCPTGFPPFRTGAKHTKATGSNQRPLADDEQDRDRPSTKAKFLDWNETAKEIRDYGATAFERKQKRAYEDEEYFKLTGRQKKKTKVPLPIVRGIRKKAAEREARQIREAREAGIVVPSKSRKAGKDDVRSSASNKINRHYGPAPSVGFMKKGVLRVKNNRRSK
mmetsp:Transcript_18945/g.52634  ORF Transcript_18945/g.52634 Transcript_18945/m.52634 type:complete len:196 (-) Transcript_18945:1548-2135(-)